MSDKSATLGRLAANLRVMRKSSSGLRDSLLKSTTNKSLGKFASMFEEHLATADKILETIDKIIDGVDTLREYERIEPELLRQHQFLCDVNTGTFH